MSTDLSAQLDAACRSRRDWSADQALRVLSDAARSCIGSEVDWDWEAGETWARLVAAGTVLMLIRVDVPFGFIVEGAPVSLGVLPEVLRILAVSDMDRPCFSVSRRALDEFLGSRELSAAFDETLFSASDLWWATI